MIAGRKKKPSKVAYRSQPRATGEYLDRLLEGQELLYAIYRHTSRAIDEVNAEIQRITE